MLIIKSFVCMFDLSGFCLYTEGLKGSIPNFKIQICLFSKERMDYFNWKCCKFVVLF